MRDNLQRRSLAYLTRSGLLLIKEFIFLFKEDSTRTPKNLSCSSRKTPLARQGIKTCTPRNIDGLICYYNSNLQLQLKPLISRHWCTPFSGCTCIDEICYNRAHAHRWSACALLLPPLPVALLNLFIASVPLERVVAPLVALAPFVHLVGGFNNHDNGLDTFIGS